MKNRRNVARKYAKALFLLSQKEKLTGKVQNDLAAITHSFRVSDKLWEILENPLIEAKDKREAIVAAFKDRVEAPTLKILEVLALNRQIGALPAIAERFNVLADEAAGIARALVRSAFPLTDAQRENIAAKLGAFCGKKVILEIKEDPSLIAGLMIKVGDHFFERSLKSISRQLKTFLEGSPAAGKAGLS